MKNKIKPYEETHQEGIVELVNHKQPLDVNGLIHGDFGIQIADDGRVWICIDEIAFLRFKPMKRKVFDKLMYSANITKKKNNLEK